MNKDTPEKVYEAYKKGILTRKEADTYLREVHNTTLVDITPDKRIMPMLGLILIIGAALAISMFFSSPTGSLTGFFVHNNTIQSGEITETPINISIESLRSSGTLTGEGTATITFLTGNEELLVGIVTSDDGSPRTDQPSYSPGENVTIENPPANASYYLDYENETVSVGMPFSAPNETAELLIVTPEKTYRLPIVIGDSQRTTSFNNLCVDTCELDNKTGIVRILVEGEAFLEITLTGTESIQINEPPYLLAGFGNITVNNTVMLDLSLYFADPEGSELLFSVGSSEFVHAEVEGNILTITPIKSGTDFLPVYASDLEELIQEDILINVQVENETNSTVNETLVNATDNSTPSTNTTQNNTSAPNVTTPPGQIKKNETNSTGPLRCNHPNPNKLPVDCLHEEASTYLAQDVHIENIARANVARVNPIGNMLITGDVIEFSNGQPNSGDWAIGYRDADLEQEFTVWIDSSTGNLHLKGQLFEEVQISEPPAGSYTITNKRGLVLAYADRTSGDLYIRGNIIPYRRDIE